MASRKTNSHREKDLRSADLQVSADRGVCLMTTDSHMQAVIATSNDIGVVFVFLRSY